MKRFQDLFWLTHRQMLLLVRQPWYVAALLLQPSIWLFLYFQVFEGVVRKSDLFATSYIGFIAPGVIVTSCATTAGWNGLGLASEINGGQVQRLLVLPVWREAMLFGRVSAVCLATVLQATALFLVAFGLGARYTSVLDGLIVALLCSTMLATSLACVSNALALLTQKSETLIGLASFILLPLTFMTPSLVPLQTLPTWMQRVSSLNPLSWAIEATRIAMTGHLASTGVLTRLFLLSMFLLVSASAAMASLSRFSRHL